MTCGCSKSEPFVTNNVQWRESWEACPAGKVSPVNQNDFTYSDLKYPCCPGNMNIFHRGENGNDYCDNK